MPNPINYFLYSPRLGFRLWTLADLPLALALWTNFAVTRYLGGPFSPQQAEEKFRREIALQEAVGVQYWPFSALDRSACGLCWPAAL